MISGEEAAGPASWSALWDPLKRAAGVLVVLDFDGTLVPLAPQPEDVRLSAPVRALLGEIHQLPRTRVVVISGRSLADLQNLVGVPSLFYGGSYGMDMRGPAFEFQHREAFLLRPVLEKVARACRDVLIDIDGARVESKPLGVAVHFRNVSPRSAPGLVSGLERLRLFSRSWPIRWRRGLEVWEAIPRVSWDKGQAVQLLRHHFHDPFTLAVGDDRSDEDMFRALAADEGIGVRVAPVGATRAAYQLTGQGDVFPFLEILYGVLKGGAHG